MLLIHLEQMNEQELRKERQSERLKFIDLCAYVLGYVNRRLIMGAHDVKEAYASRDIKEYQRLSLEQLSYNASLKAYEPVSWFEPIYQHTIDEALLLISEGEQRKVCIPEFSEGKKITSIAGVEPKLEIIAPVLRAVSRGLKVEIEYISTSSGQSSRLIAPHSIITAGNFKYVRAFDHKTGEYRVFKLNRIINARLTSWKIDPEMQKHSDKEWNETATLIIQANPHIKHKESIEFDYDIINGSLDIQIQKALIPFFLMDWNIADAADLAKAYPERFPLQVVKTV